MVCFHWALLPQLLQARSALEFGWGGQTFPYTKSTGLYQCPSDSGSDSNSMISGYNRNVPRERMAVKRLNTRSHSVLLFEVTNAQADAGRSR